MCCLRWRIQIEIWGDDWSSALAGEKATLGEVERHRSSFGHDRGEAAISWKQRLVLSSRGVIQSKRQIYRSRG
jgi:hypothetical protein